MATLPIIEGLDIKENISLDEAFWNLYTESRILGLLDMATGFNLLESTMRAKRSHEPHVT